MAGSQTILYGQTIQGRAALTPNWTALYKACEQFHRFKIEITDASENAEISYNQIKWWKGILLPELARHTGDTKAYWETLLKLMIMPDKFQPVKVKLEDGEFTFIPSITDLSMKELNTLMESSVHALRNKPFNLTWVTLPDSAKRKNKIKETAND